MIHSHSRPLFPWPRKGLGSAVAVLAAAAVVAGSLSASTDGPDAEDPHSAGAQLVTGSQAGLRGSMHPMSLSVDPTCGDEVLSQSILSDLITPDTVQCGDTSGPAPFSSDNGMARAFVIPEGEPFTVNCVRFGIEVNSAIPWDVDVNVYEGDIEGPFADLTLLGRSTVTVPADITSEFFTAHFEDPIVVDGGSSMVVELFIKTRNPNEGGPGGFTFVASNTFGQTGPSYLRSDACDISEFVTYEQIGFPQVHLLIDVYGGAPQSCPGDLNTDGVVDVADLLKLLSEWGPCRANGDCQADLNGDGVVDVADLLQLLGAWGACPEPPDPTGACCIEPENCQDLTAEQCAAEGGFFAGVNVLCENWLGCGPPGECADNCASQAPSGCYCDESCISFGDCCADICHDCPQHAHCSECWHHECPPGAIDEGEPCGADTNEGCNLEPHQYTPISCGDTICGTVWAQSGTRDTDWFELDLTGFDEPVLITWSVNSSIPLNAFIMHSSCPAIVVASDVSCQASVSYCFDPGVYTVFIAPTALNHYACDGTGPVSYVAHIECTGGTGCIPPEETCAGHCGGSSDGGCWCDSTCQLFDDCCDDVCDHCQMLHFCHPSDGSCENACGGQGSASCFCDDGCADFGDCCDDVCVHCPDLGHCL